MHRVIEHEVQGLNMQVRHSNAVSCPLRNKMSHVHCSRGFFNQINMLQKARLIGEDGHRLLTHDPNRKASSLC